MRLKLVFLDGPVEITSRRKVAGMRAIVAEVAERHRLPVDAIMGRSAERRVSHPRQEAYFRSRTELGQSFPSIGQFFGRDHATIIYGVRKHAERLAGQ